MVKVVDVDHYFYFFAIYISHGDLPIDPFRFLDPA